MIADYMKSNELMTTLSWFIQPNANKKEFLNIVKNYIKKSSYSVDYMYAENKNYSLSGRYDVLPFLEQIQEDISELYGRCNCPIKRCNWGKDNTVKYFEEEGWNDFWALCWHYGGYYECVFFDEDWIRIYHLTYLHGTTQGSGGFCVIIDKKHNNIFNFKLGEDDGNIFPDTCYYEDIEQLNEFETWRLTSILNDIHIPNTDTQKIISNFFV